MRCSDWLRAASSIPVGRVKLGSFLVAIAREAGGLTDEEHALFESVRIKSEARAVSFE
jgi:hypothetical protein